MDPPSEGLYPSLIVARARHPRMAGVIDGADGAATGANPLCGDQTHITVRSDSQRRLQSVRHRTTACMICMASADLMAERVEGMDPSEVVAYAKRMELLIQGRLDPGEVAQMGGVGAFSELKSFPTRRQCAWLPFKTLLEAL